MLKAENAILLLTGYFLLKFIFKVFSFKSEKHGGTGLYI